MASGEIPELQKVCIIPEEGPYMPYQTEESAGLMVGVVLKDRLFHTGYLRARGVHMLARLDTARCEVVQANEIAFDVRSPYVQALKRICDKEIAGELPGGSSIVSRQALLNGYFERTVWISEVTADQVKSPNDIDM